MDWLGNLSKKSDSSDKSESEPSAPENGQIKLSEPVPQSKESEQKSSQSSSDSSQSKSSEKSSEASEKSEGKANLKNEVTDAEAAQELVRESRERDTIENYVRRRVKSRIPKAAFQQNFFRHLKFAMNLTMEEEDRNIYRRALVNRHRPNINAGNSVNRSAFRT